MPLKRWIGGAAGCLADRLPIGSILGTFRPMFGSDDEDQDVQPIPLDQLDVHRLVEGEVPEGWNEYLLSEYPGDPAMQLKVMESTIAQVARNQESVVGLQAVQEMMAKLLLQSDERRDREAARLYEGALQAQEARDEAYRLSIQVERDEGWWAAYCNLWKRHPLPMLAAHALAVYAAYKVGSWVARMGAYAASTAALHNEMSRLNLEIEGANRQMLALQSAPQPEPVEMVREVHHHPVTMQIGEAALAGSMGALLDAMAGDGRFRGARGPVGLTGARGKPGRNGRDGKDGKDGKDGQRGKTGKAGARGKAGKDGRTGRNGRDGLRGADGRDGRDGRDGQAGKDGWIVGKTSKATSAEALIASLKETKIA